MRTAAEKSRQNSFGPIQFDAGLIQKVDIQAEVAEKKGF